jgi:fructokinase
MNPRPVIFGEVLFDHFPDGRRVLGGAPFNVAWHLQAFGESPLMVSRVGEDADGLAVREAMSNWGMAQSALQTDPERPTGQVRVTIEQDEPSYEIVHPAAWDAIEPLAALPACSLLYHGSLALRSTASRSACKGLRAAVQGCAGRGRVFVDVNLREPWWQREAVLESLAGADWVKLNRQELELLWPDGDSEDPDLRFLEAHDLGALLLTDGSNGARMLTAQGEVCEVRPQADIQVVDTVGAGDAMASVTILGLLRGWPLPTTLERAQAFASAIVGQRGATVAEPALYDRFAGEWSLNREVYSG